MLSKGGINIAGDFVLEKKVEYEVANVENGGIGIQINQRSSSKSAANSKGEPDPNGEKPPKPRETMTFKCGKNVLDGHLTLLFNKLTQEKWIEGYEANFKALFSGNKDADCELTWISSFGKGTLVWLFKTLATEELITVPNGYTIPIILEGHFKDKKGQWLMGLDKGDNPNKKAKPTFIECVKLLKINPNGSYDEQNEDVQLRYDPFDHQDLHLHQK